MSKREEKIMVALEVLAKTLEADGRPFYFAYFDDDDNIKTWHDLDRAEIEWLADEIMRER